MIAKEQTFVIAKSQAKNSQKCQCKIEAMKMPQHQIVQAGALVSPAWIYPLSPANCTTPLSNKTMKAKLAILMTVGLFSCHLALAQTDSAGGQAASPASTNDAAMTDGFAPVAEPATEAAPATEAVPAAEAAPAAAVEEPAPERASTSTPTTPVSEEIIPLIQFQDVQLTTAVENLARQAQLNYILDPKVGYGQPDERGQPRPQPSISIRWENVTAQQALLALLGTYGLQLVEDPRTRIARITVKDPALPDPLVTQIYQLKYTSVSNMVSALQASLTDKRSRVIPDVRSGQVVVVATEKEQDAVQKMIDRLDTITKQVLIEAKLIESSLNPSTAKGIDWAGTLAAQNVAFGNNSGYMIEPTLLTSSNLQSAVIPGLLSGVLTGPGLLAATGPGANSIPPSTYFLNADGVSAVLSFLNSAADARIIATPRAVTLDNETVHLAVTRAEPIFKVQASTQNTTGGSEVTYTNLGVILNVTPRISANNYINLKVTPEVSRVFATRTKTVAGSVNQADAYDLRRIETSVMIPSGHTLVMGGLVQDDYRTGNSKVPILGDIPLLGLAFRKDTKSRDQGNLMIFITPTVIGDDDFQKAPKSDFLSTPPQENPNEEWSVWDSGKPWDWSKAGNK